MQFIKEVPKVGRGYNKRGLFRCRCGNEVEARISHVKGGRIISCGCSRKDAAKLRMQNPNNRNRLIQSSITHGLRKHPLYTIWADIIKRCENKNCRAYKYYGERGVKICDEWRRDFKAFYEWAIKGGWQHGLEIDKDKIPKELGIPAVLYSPKMCSFVTRKENMNAIRSNRIFEINGCLNGQRCTG